MKLLTTLFLFFLGLNVFSQALNEEQFQFEFSEPYQKENEEGMQVFNYRHPSPKKYLNNKRSIYCYSDYKLILINFNYENGAGVVQTFDRESLAFIHSNEIKPEENGDFLRLMVLEKRIVFFTTKYHISKKSHSLYVTELNLETLELMEPIELLNTSEKAVPGTIADESIQEVHHPTFFITRSFDRSKILVQYRYAPEIVDDKDNYDEMGFAVFSETFEELSRKELKMPFSEARINNSSFGINDAGEVFLLVMKYEDESAKVKKKGEVNYHYEVFKIKGNKIDVVQTSLSIPDKYLRYGHFRVLPNNKLMVLTYMTNSYTGVTVGYSYWVIDQSGENVAHNSMEFTKEMWGYKGKKSSDERLYVKEVTTNTGTEEINILVQGEFPSAKAVVMDNLPVRTYSKAFFIQYDKTGELKHQTELPIFTYTTQVKFIGTLTHLEKDGTHYFFFEDRDKNLDKPLTDKPKLHWIGKGGYILGYKVVNGEAERIMVMDMTKAYHGKELFNYSRPRIIVTDSEDVVFEFYKKKGENVLLKVTPK